MMVADTTWVAGQSLLRALDLSLGSGDPTSVLLAEVAQKRLAVVRLTNPNAPWPLSTLEMIRPGKPVIVMIGDDPSPCGRSLGPGGWRARRDLKSWCKAAVIHGAAPTREQYRHFAASAQLYSRLALVECDHTTATAWADAIAAERTLVILPDPACGVPARGPLSK